MHLNAIQIFTPSRFQRLPWMLHSFTVSASHGKKTVTRKVLVFCPIKAAASLGAGAQSDENVREDEMNEIDRFLRQSGQPRKGKPMEVVGFLHAMGQSLKAGINVTDALKRAASNAKTPYFRGVLACMAHYANTVGGELSRAMALFPETFNEVVVARIEAGEATGRLMDAFVSLAESEKEDYKLRRKLMSLLVYPGLLAVAISGLFSLVQFFVLPRMGALFQSMSHGGLPLSTRIVMGAATFLKTHWYVLALPICLIILAIKKRKNIFGWPTWQRVVVAIPVVGTVMRHVIAIRSLRVLSTLLSAGAPMAKTFEIVARVSGNVVFAEYFNAIFARMRAGDQIDRAFFTERYRIGEIGRDIAQQMQIAASTGDPEEAIGPLIEIQTAELQSKMETLPVFLNFSLLLCVMPFIILIALAIIEPSLAMAQDIKSVK